MPDADRAKDRLEHEGEDIAGKVKEGVGKATGNERLEAEGQGEQLGAKVKKAGDDIREGVADAADAVRERMDDGADR